MMAERTHYVYTAYDAEGRALYVGCTKNPQRRFLEHVRSDGAGQQVYGWFGSYVVKWRVTGPLPKPVAYEIERQRIAHLQPPFNALSKGNRVRQDRRYVHQSLVAYIAEQEAKAAA